MRLPRVSSVPLSSNLSDSLCTVRSVYKRSYWLSLLTVSLSEAPLRVSLHSKFLYTVDTGSFILYDSLPDVETEWIALLFRICEVLLSVLGSKTSYPH
jgi:hypothetical protein